MVQPAERRLCGAKKLLEKIPEGEWVAGVVDEKNGVHGVTMDEHDAELALEISEKGRDYGYADEYLRPLRYTAKSYLATLRKGDGKVCEGSMTLPLAVLHLVTPFLNPDELLTLLMTSPVFFADRDEVIWRPMYNQVFRYGGGHERYAKMFASAVADRPKGSLNVNGRTFIISGTTMTPSGITPASGLSIDGQVHISMYPVGVSMTMIALTNAMPAKEQQKLLGDLFALGLNSVTYSPSPAREPLPEPPSLLTQYRIAVIGAGNVGKSAISVQYIQETFVSDYDPNICDTYKKQDKVDSKMCFLEVVDMAGQEEYASLRSQYYRKSDGLLAVYSVTDVSSLEELKSQYSDVLQERGNAVPTVLIGNKCDTTNERTVDAEWGLETAAIFGDVPFLETSAKEKINIAEAFHQLVREIRAERQGLGCAVRSEACRRKQPLPPQPVPQQDRFVKWDPSQPPPLPPRINTKATHKKLSPTNPPRVKSKKKSRKRCTIM